jgi:RecJ-like exonuclease
MTWEPKPGTEGRFRKTTCDGCGKTIHEYRNRPKCLCAECQKKEDAGQPLPIDLPRVPKSTEDLLASLIGAV